MSEAIFEMEIRKKARRQLFAVYYYYYHHHRCCCCSLAADCTRRNRIEFLVLSVSDAAASVFFLATEVAVAGQKRESEALIRFQDRMT